jgi:hypothetical protein
MSNGERRAEQHVIVDSLPDRTVRSGKRIQFELALVVTVLLAIFGILMKNSVAIADLQAHIEEHQHSDDTRTEALADAVSNLSSTDDRILITIERILTQQEDISRRMDRIDTRVHNGQ